MVTSFKIFSYEVLASDLHFKLGMCINSNSGFVCVCDGTGFNGSICQNDINECLFNSTICNYGSCVNKIGSL